MKAVVLESFGGLENLKLADVPDPKPGPGEVLLKVRACALNHLDLWVREGIPAYKIKTPHILGCDVAGEVAAVGAGVETAKVGDRAAVYPGRSCGSCPQCLAGLDNFCPRYGIIGAQAGPGGYAEYLAVPAVDLLPMRGGMTFEEAASYPLTFLTAWHMVMTLGGCAPGQNVLVLGAGSGTSVAAIQVAKLAGATVIASSTSQEKLARAKELGADALIQHPPEDLVKRTLGLTGGRMADIVIDHVGPATFDASLKSLRHGGRLVTCGATTGPMVQIDLRYVFSRQLQILGSKMGSRSEMLLVARLVQEGKLRPVVDKVFPLSQARQAHEHLADKKQFGKVVLSIGG